MFVHNLSIAASFGRRVMSTAPGKLPVHVLSLHRRFPYTLYKANPGERSVIVDQTTAPPRSERFCDRNEAKYLVEGRIHPTITRTKQTNALSQYVFFQEFSWVFIDQYYDSLDEGLKPVVPYIFQVPKGAPPVKGLSLGEFNGALDMFYSNRVEKIIAEKWLEEHEYDSAGADDDPSSWR